MKTPTIKELRALAKRKGVEIETSDGLCVCDRLGAFVRIYRYKLPANRFVILHSVLRALPDKKVAR